jgi:hypothetical protein
MLPVIRIQREVPANPHGGVPFVYSQVADDFLKGLSDYKGVNLADIVKNLESDFSVLFHFLCWLAGSTGLPAW